MVGLLSLVEVKVVEVVELVQSFIGFTVIAIELVAVARLVTTKLHLVMASVAFAILVVCGFVWLAWMSVT